MTVVHGFWFLSSNENNPNDELLLLLFALNFCSNVWSKTRQNKNYTYLHLSNVHFTSSWDKIWSSCHITSRFNKKLSFSIQRTSTDCFTNQPIFFLKRWQDSYPFYWRVPSTILLAKSRRCQLNVPVAVIIITILHLQRIQSLKYQINQ